jgi:hypothetical protein
VTQEELTAWAKSNGWRELGGFWSLAKPGKPKDAIVRLVMKTTVVNVEIRKPAGKWEKVSGAAYGAVEPDPDTGVPRGLGLVSIPGFTRLMQDNKDAQVFG